MCQRRREDACALPKRLTRNLREARVPFCISFRSAMRHRIAFTTAMSLFGAWSRILELLPMTLSPKAKRIIWVSAAVIVIVLALGAFFTWTKFFREEKEVFANEEEHFKYGSLGAEGDRGIPYYLWMVLPRIFPELMPGPGGYKSFGVVWEEGHEIPVGFSKKIVGFARITNNCAVCHTATYRLSEDEVPHVVAGGPA